MIGPWMARVAKGFYHIALGWNYRGNGYARSVTDENRKKFKTEISKARKFLVQAYELHPEYPEAAVKMINVSEEQVLNNINHWKDGADQAN